MRYLTAHGQHLGAPVPGHDAGGVVRMIAAVEGVRKDANSLGGVVT